MTVSWWIENGHTSSLSINVTADLNVLVEMTRDKEFPEILKKLEELERKYEMLNKI